MHDPIFVSLGTNEYPGPSTFDEFVKSHERMVDALKRGAGPNVFVSSYSREQLRELWDSRDA